MPQFYEYVQQKLPNKAVEKAEFQHTHDLLIVKSRAFVSMPEHYSDDYHVNLIPSPPPPLTINRKDCCFNKKSAIVMPPGISISCKYELPAQDYFLVTISKSRFNDVLTHITPTPRIDKTVNFPYSRLLFSNVQNMYAELQHKYPGHDLMVQSKLTEFIILLIREGKLFRNQERSLGKNYNYTDKALEYIHSYYSADISLDDLCAELNLSRYHFIRIFKEHTGTTPHAYLLGLRLQHALEYLKRNELTLGEIASLCGFISQTHFSQCFKKKYGITPANFREKP